MSHKQSKTDMLNILLDAIRIVKRQKQRPNAERITQFMKKKYDPQTTVEAITKQLEDSVKSGQIVKKYNRDDFTYEDAKNSSNNNSDKGKDNMSPTPLSLPSTSVSLMDVTVEQVVKAVEQLSQDKPGCRIGAIEQYLTGDGELNINTGGVKKALEGAVKEGKLVKEIGGLYHLEAATSTAGHVIKEEPPVKTPPVKTPSRKKSVTTPLSITTTPILPSSKSTATSPIHATTSGQLSVGGLLIDSPSLVRKKMKMAKPIPVCSFCLGDEHMNKRTEVPEDMVACGDCGMCGHPTCLMWPPELYEKVRTLRWQCLKCKKCSLCGIANKGDEDLLLCDGCDRGFHMKCCDPPLIKPPKGTWLCNICEPARGRAPIKPMIDDELFPFTNIVNAAGTGLTATPTNLANQSRVSSSSQGQSQGPSSHHRDNLVDGLSNYYKPGNKRQSRVSKHAMLVEQTPTSSGAVQLSLQVPTATVVSANDPWPGDLTPAKLRQLQKQQARLEVRHAKEMERAAIKAEKERVKAAKRDALLAKKQQKQKSSAGMAAARKLLDKSKKKKQDETKKRGRKPGSQKRATDGGDEPIKRGPGRPRKVPLQEGPSTGKTLKVDKGGTGRKRKKDVDDTSGVTSKPKKRKVVQATSIKDSDSSSDDSFDNELTKKTLDMEAADDPYPITEQDRNIFAEIQREVQNSLPTAGGPDFASALSRQQPNGLVKMDERGETTGTPLESPTAIFASNEGRFPPKIQLGKYIIHTWYSSPYPSEYARLGVLYICEYCLKYIKSLTVYIRHMEKCPSNFPPGNEIYRRDNLSVWEVDGYTSKLYCQSLCLLAKLFLDHKTLYYDVEPFLFYVVTVCEGGSCHLVGYFSKEKHSAHKYNLSCIMVLPQYQKAGYGRFLIEFSYLLSKIEGEAGSPEKPLSELGRLSYDSYWRSKLVPLVCAALATSKPSLLLYVLSKETGIDPHDVAATLQTLSVVHTSKEGKLVLAFDSNQLSRLKTKYDSKSPSWITVDADCLRWSPLVQSRDFSPHASPLRRLSSSSPVGVVSRPTEKKKTRGEETTCSVVAGNRRGSQPPPDSPGPDGAAEDNVRTTRRRSSTNAVVNGGTGSQSGRGSSSGGRTGGRRRSGQSAPPPVDSDTDTEATPRMTYEDDVIKMSSTPTLSAESPRRRGRPKKMPRFNPLLQSE